MRPIATVVVSLVVAAAAVLLMILLFSEDHILDLAFASGDCTVTPREFVPVCSNKTGGFDYCPRESGTKFAWIADEPFSIEFIDSGNVPVGSCKPASLNSEAIDGGKYRVQCKTRWGDYQEEYYEYTARSDAGEACSINPHIIVRD